MNCKSSNQIISLEYSRNFGLSWQLIQFYLLNVNQMYIIHEDFFDEIRYDHILIRLVFQTNLSKCVKLEQVNIKIFLNQSIKIFFNRLL